MKRAVVHLLTISMLLLFVGGCFLIPVAVVNSVIVDMTTVELSVAANETVTATAYDEDLNEIADAAFTWESDDTSVATVVNGVITGVAAGDATITVTSGDATADVTVIVREGDNPGPGIYTETYFELGASTLMVNSANGESFPVLGDAPASAGTVDGDTALQVDFSGIGAWGGLYWSYGDSGVDASAYENGDLVFSIRTSAAARVLTEMSDLEIKIEDTSTANTVHLNALTGTADGEWTEYKVKVSDFSDIDMSSFKTLGFWNPDVDQVVFFDKIYFTTTSTAESTISEPTSGPTAPVDNAAKNYIPLFTDVTFTNSTAPGAGLSVPSWWGDGSVVDFTAGSDTVKKATTGTGWFPLEFTVDADTNGMTHLRVTVWTPAATEIKIKLVDFGGDGWSGGNDTEHELTFNASSTPALSGTKTWVTLDIPLADFSTLAGTTQLSQLIVTSNGTIFFDDLYFHD